MILRKLRRRTRPTGQALVEFALVLIILLLVIFVLVEAARLLFAYATLQHAVRTGARYGITGQFDETIPLASTQDPRVQSIKTQVLGSANGLHIEPEAIAGEPYYINVEVWGADGSGGPLLEDFAGVARWPLRVRAQYRLPMVTPLTIPIAESVLLNAEVVMNNEAFDQVAGSRLSGGASAPPIPERSEADLTIRQFDSQDPVTAGEEFDYRIEVRNNGPLPATNVTVIDRLDPTLSFVSTDPVDMCHFESGELDCFLGEIRNGQTFIFYVRVRTSVVQLVTNRVELSGDQHDPHPTDNVAIEETSVE